MATFPFFEPATKNAGHVAEEQAVYFSGDSVADAEGREGFAFSRGSRPDEFVNKCVELLGGVLSFIVG